MKESRVIELYKKYREIVNYLIFGMLTTAVNWITYSILIEFAGFSITASNAIAWFMAVIFAFITNKIYVFNSSVNKISEFFRETFLFFCSRFVSGIIEVFLPGFLFSIGLNQSVFGVKGFASKVTVSILVIILNYIFSKFFVFNADRKDN